MNDFDLFLSYVRNELQSEQEVLISKHLIANIKNLYMLNIEDLAKQSFCSTTSIIRFVRKMGFDSFSDFKERIAKAVGKQSLPAPKQRELRFAVSQKDYLDKLYQRKEQDLKDLPDKVCYDEIEHLADVMMNSHSITLVGNGLEEDCFNLTFKTLSMYLKPCYVFQEQIYRDMHLASLNKDDLVLFISCDKKEGIYQSICICDQKQEDIVLLNDCPYTIHNMHLLDTILVYAITKWVTSHE